MIMDVLKDILLELGISEESITEDTFIRKNLQLDSTETVEVSLEMKRRLGVKVKIESRQDMTLGDICSLVTEAKATSAK